MPRHPVDDAGPGVQAGESKAEEAHHCPEGDRDPEGAYAVGPCELYQRRVLPGRPIVVSARYLDVAHEDEPNACEGEAPDDRLGNVLERVPGLAAQRGGALEADEAEDRYDDPEAQAVKIKSFQLQLSSVDRKAVLEKDYERQNGDAGNRQRFDDQGEGR